MSETKLTKKEAMALLGISTATMSRWMTSGKIKYSKIEAGRFQSAVFFDAEEIARLLPVRVTVPVSALKNPAPAANPRKEPKDLRTFAEKYLDGDECDSCGNYVDGSNPWFPSTGSSLIGPCIPAAPEPRTSTTSHMDPALVGKVGGTSANDGYLDSFEYALARGAMTQAHYDALQADATRAHRLSGQEKKIWLDKAAILHAMRFGYSR